MTFRGSGTRVAYRWIKAFEAGGGVAIRDRLYQANRFHLEVTTSDPRQASSGRSGRTNLRSSPRFVPFAFEKKLRSSGAQRPAEFPTYFLGSRVSSYLAGLSPASAAFWYHWRALP
jgi:hypothetical protein